MTLENRTASLLAEALSTLEKGFTGLPDFEPQVDMVAIRDTLMETAERLKDNYPYPHPFYMGQMITPPHPVARMAYMLSLYVNPNNHALDGGRASSAMEKECVAKIAEMFGYPSHLGHLTSGGTFANLEALWIAGRLHPDKLIVASQQAHYTHSRICGVLRAPFQEIPCDEYGRMRIDALTEVVKTGRVGTVVATVGATAVGAVDPLTKLLELQEEYGFRLHVDAAYGGYFTLTQNLAPETRAVYDHLSESDSIVVDPHKLGLQPYGCGCVLFKDPSVGKFYKHESPYTYFTSSDLHLGEISLECSRAGSSAVALWATMRMMPLIPGGEFARGLEKTREAALKLHARLSNDSRFMSPFPPELNIVIWTIAGRRASEISARADKFFDEAARRELHLAKANLPKAMLAGRFPDIEWDQDHLTCLRSCLMKPEHYEWMDKIYSVMGETADEVIR